MSGPLPPHPPPGAGWRGLMEKAFSEACLAAQEGEAPIGAALFSMSGECIASAHNRPIGLKDPTAHAEILCLRQAGERLNNYRLGNTILAVTLEPCIMCMGAILHARVAGVVYGAPDPGAGALVSNLTGASLPFANHSVWTIGGVMEEECGDILRRFFLQKRKG